MNRFILVDPSFDGVTGDKWQYAVAFARSARANGMQFILLSARSSPQLPLIDDEAVDQRPIFSFGFYEHEQIVTRQHRTPVALRQRQQRVREQRERARLDEELQRAGDDGDIGRRELLRRRVVAWEREAARAAARLQAERDTDTELAEPFNRDDFGAALAHELQAIEPHQGDVLFFHTMTPAMLESFSEASLHLPGRETFDVDAYCLFHFGAEAPDARTFLDRYHSFSHFGSLAARLRVGSPFRRLHLLATSEVLAAECRELFGLPFGVFHGLSNMAEHFRACGGEEAAQEIVRAKVEALRSRGELRLAIRAGDLDRAVADSIIWAWPRLLAFGFQPRLRVLYHGKTFARTRDVLDWFGDIPVSLVDVESNDDYIVELAHANLVLLSYPPERYAKRVSAVLHDCAVLGTSCVVPEGTTMADSAAYADVWAYRRAAALGPVLLQAARALRRLPPAEREARVLHAREIYGQDVVRAIVGASAQPSLTVPQRGPIAAFFMPAWGRCGSSYALEGQIRFLLAKGFFVVQVLVMDKAVDRVRALPYLWRLLLENSQLMRGSVQRVAFATFEEIQALETSPAYAALGAFEQYLERIGAASVRDTAAVQALARADVAVVNHVFNSRIAGKYVRCQRILETHDVQSFQMFAWPLRREGSDTPEPLDLLLRDEMKEVAGFDHVINVAPNEHQMLSIANPRATLITPYVVFEKPAESARVPDSISQLVDSWGLSHHYRDVHRFDLLLLGDSHPANRESAEWFIEKVYLPYLQPAGRSLAIAGRITEHLYAKFGTIGCIFYIGFVPDVKVLRALCTVAVLPDMRGTGISIKTLETFASGQPFVATSRALRGFRHLLPDTLRSHDDPLEFSARIDHLLHDAAELGRCAESAREAYALLASEAAFTQAWEGVLREVRVQL